MVSGCSDLEQFCAKLRHEPISICLERAKLYMRIAKGYTADQLNGCPLSKRCLLQILKAKLVRSIDPAPDRTQAGLLQQRSQLLVDFFQDQKSDRRDPWGLRPSRAAAAPAPAPVDLDALKSGRNRNRGGGRSTPRK